MQHQVRGDLPEAVLLILQTKEQEANEFGYHCIYTGKKPAQSPRMSQYDGLADGLELLAIIGCALTYRLPTLVKSKPAAGQQANFS